MTMALASKTFKRFWPTNRVFISSKDCKTGRTKNLSKKVKTERQYGFGNEQMADIINKLREKISARTEVVDILTEDDIWERHGTIIWQANRFDGSPIFNPVYKWNNLYSYSLLALIIAKGNLKVNQRALAEINSANFLVLPNPLNIDAEITRIGGQHAINKSIKDVEVFAQRIALALKAHIANIEAKNQGYINYVLCGGKDSLNLLLLPWSNQTIALSAER